MNNYIPNPLDTSHIELSAPLKELLEQLALNTHEVWSATRLAQGWTWGPSRDDANKKHPCLIPYDQLSEAEKELDRGSARETLKAILLLGYSINDPTSGDEADEPA
jgi:ryanodine receptor 2